MTINDPDRPPEPKWYEWLTLAVVFVLTVAAIVSDAIVSRILITGSRDWDNSCIETTTLAQELVGYVKKRRIKDPVLVSGACPTGADKMAENAFEAQGWAIERHPADWKTHGKAAGFIRNAEMVNSGVDICFAFIRNRSKGASHTRDLAMKAGITVHTYRSES